ncbi:ANTAR domain-containing protein [Actinoplanes utahensis]|uniref:ANTAR domain-containing protein n=1 Tax=Actinoplanes utahensis TaxID=1869 RepID=UPI0009FC2915
MRSQSPAVALTHRERCAADSVRAEDAVVRPEPAPRRPRGVPGRCPGPVRDPNELGRIRLADIDIDTLLTTIARGDRRCTAEDAFAILVKLSQDTNRKLRDVASTLVENAQRRPRP